MKKTILFISAALFSIWSIAQNDQPERIGDNLDLNGVLELFEKSKSVEDFENQINSEKNDVNNLDLNDDGYVDYIRVIDYADGNSHSLTLQVPYSDKEAQDVAVIYLEEEGESATIQVVGDENLYGENYIVEPAGDTDNDVVNVYHWKTVRHVYSPGYTVWVSPWRWGVYPKRYKPWKPVAWTVFHGRRPHYHRTYRVVHVHRNHHAHKHYHKHRVHSNSFHKHHPHYSHHKSAVKTGGKKTTVVKKSGNKTVKKKTTTKKKSNVKKPSGQKTKTKSKGGGKQQKLAGKPTKRPGAVTKSPSNSGGKNSGNKRRK